MTQKWIKAAERYKASNESDQKSRREQAFSKKPGAFASFVASNNWNDAIQLLAAANRTICLGYSEVFLSQTTAVIIDGEGLKSHTGVVGLAAAYIKEKPKQRLITAADAISMLASFPPDGNMLTDHDENKLVANIIRELDDIAVVAP
jgi:hypothetical protein